MYTPTASMIIPLVTVTLPNAFELNGNLGKVSI